MYPLKDGKSVTINNVLMDTWIATFGCPAEIRSDQGSYFTSDEFRQWCKSLGIKQVLTPVRNPWSNTVERLIRTVNQLIRTNMASGETEWQLILPAAALAYNTKVNMSTGVTPALAFLGHELAMPVDLALQHCIRPPTRYSWGPSTFATTSPGKRGPTTASWSSR